VLEGIVAIVFRTVGDQCSLWESVLPEELRRLPEELARVLCAVGRSGVTRVTVGLNFGGVNG
jgi:hypothetical protein